MTISPKEALATVRQAYQYVAQYQQRVLDAFDMVNAELTRAGFVLWQWDSFPGYRKGTERPFDLGARHWLPLVDLEGTWAHGAKQESDNGSGTYVIVRHVADTRVNPDGLIQSDVPGGDSVFYSLVVRPTPGFTKDEFSKPWIRCVGEHFELGADLADLASLSPRKQSDRPATAQGRWSVQVLSLGDLESPVDFKTGLVQPLAAKAREFAGLMAP